MHANLEAKVYGQIIIKMHALPCNFSPICHESADQLGIEQMDGRVH